MKSQTVKLLARLGSITHADRVREAIALGRRAASDPAAAGILADLETAGFYERMLALYAAHGTRAGATVMRYLSDPSALLRGLARSLVPLLCDDTQATSALEALPRRGRVLLLQDLRKRGRTAPVDAFVQAQIANGSDSWSDFLPFCSADFVRERLPQVAEPLGANDWERLSRAHPDLAASTMNTYLAAQTEPDARLLWRLNATLPTLATFRPEAALSLASLAIRHESPDAVRFGSLASFLPDETADLLLATPGHFPATFTVPQVQRLTPERFLALLSRRPEYLPHPQKYLPELPSALRETAFGIAGESWKTAEGIIAPAVIAALPTTLREREARRHFALPALQTRPLARLPYGAFLPPAESQTVLEPFIKNPDADLRGVALAARIGTARYYSDTLADILQTVRRRENEQDPVRRALIEAVRELPPSRWQAQHLADLGQIIRDALNAADLSPATASEAEALIVSLVPFHPVWAGQWLRVYAKERGSVSLYGLEDHLTDADMKTVAPALLPVLKSWATREREDQLLAAVQCLGRRVRSFPGLLPILEDVARTTKRGYIVSSLLRTYAEHFPAKFAQVVPELIRADKSVGTLAEVYTFLHHKRQDLITPFLGRTAFGGRFSTGRTRFVLPLTSGFWRWTPAQQNTFAQTLTELTQDEARDTYAIATAIAQLSALPAVEPSRLFELAQVGAGKTAVRDLAIQALARLDGGQGIPVLIEALSDNRARVAIYSLRSALLEMPAEAAFAVLQAAPTEKVTVAKEVLRLVGELRLPAALPYLLAQSARPLHRDVRVALLRGLWDFLENADAQAVLLSAASDPDSAVASGVVRIPAERLSANAAAFLRTVLAALLMHPDPAVRVETMNRCTTLPLSDPARVLLSPLLARLSSLVHDENTVAAYAVFATYGEPDADAIGTAVGTVLPNRAALTAVLDAFLTRLNAEHFWRIATANAVLAALAPNPLTASYAARIAIKGLPGADAATVLTQIALHPEALMDAVAATVSLPAPDAEALENALRDSPDAGLRRIAFAALLAQARTRGWTPALRSRHAAYCRDGSPLVAAAAQFTILPPEAA